MCKPFARIAFALNNFNEVNNDDDDDFRIGRYDNSFGHFWIFPDHRPSAKCQCGLVEFHSEMTWTRMSILQQTFQVKTVEKDVQSKLLSFDKNLKGFLVVDLATPKTNAIFASLETAETLSSVGTVLNVN